MGKGLTLKKKKCLPSGGVHPLQSGIINIKFKKKPHPKEKGPALHDGKTAIQGGVIPTSRKIFCKRGRRGNQGKSDQKK